MKENLLGTQFAESFFRKFIQLHIFFFDGGGQFL